MKVPSFLLKRLYVKGSLRNTDDGFEFRLSNTLGSGYAQAISPVRVNGEELPAEQSSFTADGKTQAFLEVDTDNPASLAMNRELTRVRTARSSRLKRRKARKKTSTKDDVIHT